MCKRLALARNQRTADAVARAPGTAVAVLGAKLKPHELRALRLVAEETPVERRLGAQEMRKGQAKHPKEAARHQERIDLTRQAMAWAKTRPEAFSDKTGKADTRGAYGLLAREVIGLLKHLQHAQAKTVIFVGILERVTDEFNRTTWQPQMEGGKAGRELPGIVDQVITMSLFAAEGDGWRHEPERGEVRRLVCRAGNPARRCLSCPGF